MTKRSARRAAAEDSTAPKRTRAGRAIPAQSIGLLPVVAIVGRPNIGKSTLFNRLAGARIAIVEDVAGVTRDRHYATTHIGGRELVLVDTGGFDPDSDDPMREGIARHVRAALEEADLVICVLDATSAATSADRAAVVLLRQAGKPVIFVANKADSRSQSHEAMELYELGMDRLIPISALHGNNTADLEAAIVTNLPKERTAADDTFGDLPRISIVGRPNAGKSSLVNRFLGEDRQLVDSRPGTTVDAIDALFVRDDRKYVLIDTAGIRRKRGIEEQVEVVAVLKALKAIERSHCVVLLVDAKEGIAEQDARLAGNIIERGRALVVGLNKADLLDEDDRKLAMRKAKETLAFAPWAEIVMLSARTGRATKRLLDAVQAALDEHQKRITTAELNRFFEEVLERHPPPTSRGKAVRLYYVTQAEVRPPRFVVVTNEPEAVHFSYQRYVGNALRERFGFHGTPLRVTYRARSRREAAT